MSTNYYAHWRPPGSATVIVELHICKSLRSFSGLMFSSWRQWRDFLRYQSQPSRTSGGSIRVIDEYGTEHEVEQFIEDVWAVAPELRARQTEWVREHVRELGTWESQWDWLDSDGYSFHRGEFF